MCVPILTRKHEEILNGFTKINNQNQGIPFNNSVLLCVVVLVFLDNNYETTKYLGPHPQKTLCPI